MYEDRESFRRRLVEIGFETTAARTRTDGTICREIVSAGLTKERLPVLTSTAPGAIEIELGEPFARGGMGVVCEGRQLSLKRPVAIKHAAMRSDEETANQGALLLEGRVMGSLDHPNIAPVYMVGLDDEQNVVLVMKRIEGESWASLLKGPQLGEELERHIEILMDICRAVAFAHERGVLHRDLKPGNIMVGSFGEVYLLDWGLAVTLLEDDERGLPRASEEKIIMGTPGYMAPEMVVLEGGLGTHTDCFQLGAILHTIVTGKSRFEGSGFTIMRAAYECEPYEYASDVPQELQEILHRACAREGSERYTAAGLREALADFLKHENARQLAREAAERRSMLEEAIRTKSDPLRIEQLFAEARFGYRQAIAIHPVSAQAISGLEDTTLVMLRRAIDEEQVDLAEQLLHELNDPSPALESEVRELRAATGKAAEELIRLQERVAQVRPAIGRRERATILATAGVVWMLGCLAGGLLTVNPLAVLGGGGLGFSVAIFSLSSLRRRRGLSNAADRVSSLQTGGTVVAISLAMLVSWHAEVPLHAALLIAHLLIGNGQIALVLGYDPRLILGIPYFYLSVLPLFLYPEHALPLSALFGGGGLLVEGLVLRGLGESDPS